MQRQSKLLRLFGVGLSLWLLAIPTAGVWGQDEAADGTSALPAAACSTGIVLNGNGAANTLTGGPNNDTIRSRGGDDTIEGKGCNDILDGGPGKIL